MNKVIFLGVNKEFKQLDEGLQVKGKIKDISINENPIQNLSIDPSLSYLPVSDEM